MSIASREPSAVPDWSQQTEEIHCPLCDYNLRGLIEPRCPECGYSFVWRDLTDPTRRIHPYLFEHHPERKLKSFVQTVIGHLRPMRFWKSLRPEMPSNPKRLMIYWLLLLTAGLICFVVPVPFRTIDEVVSRLHFRSVLRAYIQTPAGSKGWAQELAKYHSIDAFIDGEAPLPVGKRFWEDQGSDFLSRTAWEFQGYKLPIVILFLIWPWLTLLVMGIFRISIQRARIKPIHILRAVIYSSDGLVLLMGFYLAANVIERAAYVLQKGFSSNPWWTDVPLHTTMIAACFAILTVFRLIVAFKYYLKFDHPVATVLASQIIIALSLAIVVNYTPGLLEYLVKCEFPYWPR